METISPSICHSHLEIYILKLYNAYVQKTSKLSLPNMLIFI